MEVDSIFSGGDGARAVGRNPVLSKEQIDSIKHDDWFFTPNLTAESIKPRTTCVERAINTLSCACMERRPKCR
eukprot:CAMPEP_0179212230 /NCGR_PEP_ID=MMETSP0797-20121207/985_1 /TAXON_ID=47934 /ORGANISM="Dinophysis acuminata, Strain DAEP01" /LENGTH=72 /DNA_ID=CAMNT_0020917809 /DNA_START=52 /DNA_END=270 /DNA_ORIENTATION=-